MNIYTYTYTENKIMNDKNDISIFKIKNIPDDINIRNKSLPDLSVTYSKNNNNKFYERIILLQENHPK